MELTFKGGLIRLQLSFICLFNEKSHYFSTSSIEFVSDQDVYGLGMK